VLNTPIDDLPKTSSITIRRLRAIGINTYWDFLNYFPFRYQDFSLISKINRLQPGEIVTLSAQITKAQNQYTKTGKTIQKITLGDATGQIDALWFNQPYLLRLFHPGDSISIAGEIQWYLHKLVMFPQEYQLGHDLIHAGRLVPVYPERNGLSSRVIREKMFWIVNQLDKLEEDLPEEILKFNDLTGELSAYKNVHFPDSLDASKKARHRLAFEELFTIQLASALVKKEWEKQVVANKFTYSQENENMINRFIDNLPYKLTNSQIKVISEILSDLKAEKPMNRFLEGDVGSGKTVVAAVACYLSYLSGFQSLFMAPTAILANQHFQTLSKLFGPYKIKIGLQTSARKINPDADLIVGTHALINEKLKFKKIGLVVIDEQHRFGVMQRSLLKEKGINPHLLTMTATPIPRTVALTLFGELDMSYIDEMPKGRIPVKTYFVSQEKRGAGYEWIKKEIESKGIQVFIVCPLIEESDKETMKSIRAAEKEFKNLETSVFKNQKIGLLHGRIKNKEKEKIMEDFKNKKFDILIATPVVEVGIDISNATIIIIESAERYGLAQLHQLRGRVGRGSQQSYCFLFSEKTDPEILERLHFFSKNESGQKLAEYDFRHRGPGAIFGTKQHGFFNLKIASLADFDLIKKTKSAADYFLAHYDIRQNKILAEKIKQYQTTSIINN